MGRGSRTSTLSHVNGGGWSYAFGFISLQSSSKDQICEAEMLCTLTRMQDINVVQGCGKLVELSRIYSRGHICSLNAEIFKNRFMSLLFEVIAKVQFCRV